MNHTVLCDGGLCNRLNALIFALILKRKFGHEWTISWPQNNWCGASFSSLFSSPLPQDERSIEDIKLQQDQHLLLMHENQIGFDADRLVLNGTLKGYDDYRRHLDSGRSVVYFNSLLPSFVEPGDVRDALALLQPNAEVAATAARFIAEHRIDGNSIGLHIRKTDFGDRVNDQALFEQARISPRRFFVCSDDAAVNQRFAELPNCAVFEKTAFPEKVEEGAAWQHWTTDAEGRRFPYNITRSGAAVVEGLIDLLILSQTEIVPTSGSTFLATARLFRSCRFFNPALNPATGAPVSKPDLVRLLELLQPRPLASDLLVRLGAEGDGGWSIPAALLNGATMQSIGPERSAGLPQLLAGRVAGEHRLLVLDADGAEWTALAGITGFERFDTISGVFGNLPSLVNRDFFDRAESVFSRLAASHQVVHLRMRESGGVVRLGQQPFPCVLEITWVRREGARFGEAATAQVLDQLTRAAAPKAEPPHGFELFTTLRQLHLPAPRGVMQIGASYGQEMRDFLANGIRCGVFVEPLPEPYAHLAGTCSRIPNYIPVNALCSDLAGRQHDFFVASNGGMSSSILKPANHLRVNDYVSFPKTVQLTSTTLDDLMVQLQADGHGAVARDLDLLFMDTQGAEFQILLGATKTLRQFKYLYFEVMRNDMYEGQTPFLTYCHYLDALGFTLNDLYFNHPEQTGNALFVRKDLVQVTEGKPA